MQVMKPNPPKIVVDEASHVIDITFDPAYEFTPEAAAYIKERIEESFPVGTMLTDRTRCDLEALVDYLQSRAIRRDEMQLKDPLGQLQHEAALKRLAELPAFEESVLAAPLEETEADDDHEPGEVIVELHCPCCGAALSIEYGEDPGQIVAVSDEQDQEGD